MNEISILCSCGTEAEMQFFHIAKAECVGCGKQFTIEVKE